MRNREFKWMVMTCLVLAGGLSLAEEILDPSIFDGTGRERREAPEEAESPESSPPAEGEGVMGEEEEVPAEPGAGEGAEEEGAEEVLLPDVEGGGVGGEEEKGMMEEPSSPGGPAEVMTESRAGERVESSEKIAPGQAVDFPWDM